MSKNFIVAACALQVLRLKTASFNSIRNNEQRLQTKISGNFKHEKSAEKPTLIVFRFMVTSVSMACLGQRQLLCLR
jgi:hypothetical protein